jgi:hypothetical protein
MLVYWEQNVGGVQEVNFDIEDDDEGCEIQKPQMKNDEDKEQIKDLVVNIVFIFDLKMNNNCNNARFVMQRSKDDVLGVLAKSTTIFTWSLGVFTRSSKLWGTVNRELGIITKCVFIVNK